MRASQVLFVAGALLLVAGPAAAQPEDPDAAALAHYEAGEAAYAEGRYEEAITEFEAAHALSPRPLLLYDLANAYERVGRYLDAADALEGYLPSAEEGERAQLEARVVNLRERAADPVPVDGPPEAAASGAELALVGLVVAVSGGALVLTGIVFGALALDAQARAEGDEGPCVRTGERLVCTDDGQRAVADAEAFAIVADVGLFGGWILAAAGLTLFAVGLVAFASGDGGAEASLRLTPQGLQIAGAF